MLLLISRNFIRERRLDPISLPNYKVTENWSHFELTDGLLYGLSTIHRTGSIILGFEQNSVQVTIHLGAENLKGLSYLNKLFSTTLLLILIKFLAIRY